MAKRKTKRRRGPSGPIQAVFFSAAKFTDRQGRAWLKDHDYTPLRGTRKRTLQFAATGKRKWFGWEVSRIPRGKELRWIPFGPNIRARIIVPKGTGNAATRNPSNGATQNKRPALLQQTFVFDPKQWTARSAWLWLAKMGHDHRKAERVDVPVRGKGTWFGWEVAKVPKGKKAGPWFQFAPSVRVRFITGMGAANPSTAKSTAMSTATRRNAKVPRVRTSTATATRNAGDALLRAARRRAEFLSNGMKAEEIPIDTIRIRSTRIPTKGLLFLGPFRQLNYTAPKFDGKFKEFFHRPDGFPRVGAKLMSKDGGLTFMHPDGDWILIVPGKNQRGRFRMDGRGVLN